MKKIPIILMSTFGAIGVGGTAIAMSLSLGNKDMYNYENPSKDEKIISIYDISKNIDSYNNFINEKLNKYEYQSKNVKNIENLPNSTTLLSFDNIYFGKENHIQFTVLKNENKKYELLGTFVFKYSFKTLVDFAKLHISPGTYSIAPLFYDDELTFGIVGESEIYSIDFGLNNSIKTNITEHTYKKGHSKFTINF